MSNFFGYDDSRSESWLTPPTPVMKRILIINAVIFAAQVLLYVATQGRVNDLISRCLALSGDGIRAFFVWQLGTYMFLHDPLSIWHILLNSFFLWMFGRDVEHDLGPARFLRLYLTSGVLGGLLWLGFNFNAATPVLGASGAVWGVCIAYATLYPERIIRIFFIFAMKVKYWAIFAVVIELYHSLMTLGQGRVANLAHLGGMLFGFLYIKWLGHGPAPAWMIALQKAFGGRERRQPDENDEYHSSRPGVPYNHPYRTLEEEAPARPQKRKGMLERVFSGKTESAGGEDMDKDEFMEKQVNPILEKIARQGMQSLTRQERKILESAKDRMRKRQS